MASATPVTKVTPKPPGAMLGAEAPSMAAEMPSGLYDNSVVNAPLSAGAAQQMSVALALAIQRGEVMKAQELASRLAHGHAPISVTFDAAAQERKAKEQEVRVTVHIEDRESAGLTLSDVKVRPSDTILDMKHTFLAQYNFPLEVQKWIIGNKIRSDEETLTKCEVTASGHTLYLYLLNARAVNLSSDDAVNRHRNGSMNAAGNSMHPSHGSDYETMNFPASVDFALVPPTGQGQGQISPSGHGMQMSPAGPGAARQQSQMSVHSSSSSLASPLYPPPSDLQNNLDPGSRSGSMSGGGRGGPESRLTLQGEGSAVSLTGGGEGSDEGVVPGEMMSFQQQEESAPEGWQCESCTFINQPTRPGCELCSSPRPPGYQVPAHCVVSDEERLRLEQERQVEAIMQQTSRQGWSPGTGQRGATHPPPNPPPSTQHQQALSPEQVDLILQFNDAVQGHLAATGGGGGGERTLDSIIRVDPEAVFGRGRNSQLAPSGARQLNRQPVEYGEDVPDDSNLLGWASEDEEENSHA